MICSTFAARRPMASASPALQLRQRRRRRPRGSRRRERYAEIQPPSDPMLDFDERDLMRFAEKGGFFPIELELEAEIRAMEPTPLDAFLNRSGNPRIPTIAEAMDQALTPE